MAIEVNRRYLLSVPAGDRTLSMRRIFQTGSQLAIYSMALLFFLACTWTSYARFANFQYRTFDLAYYVQAIWQLIHGRFRVTVEPVPLLGNHVEPIVFLFAPFFFLFRHPMLFVVVQNLALASMGPIGYDIAKRLGFDRKQSALLALSLLISPAAGYIALHEFHPEALTAPFLLLMFRARLLDSVKWHWIWFIAVLACKENMALLLAAYCAVLSITERRRGFGYLSQWYLWPMTVAIFWFVLCTQLITPALNPGDIDYFALYDRLGRSPIEILRNCITQPHKITRPLIDALIHGNLVWGLLLPFLFLPLLRPRWLFVAAPILLQHLLSWRTSEWMIFFHYAAPLLPLFWIALVESIVVVRRRTLVSSPTLQMAPWLVTGATVLAQVWLGPFGAIHTTTAEWTRDRSDRARKNAFVSQIPSQASVVAPFPYLAHLAMREHVYSLHYILKGLKTLSRTRYQPPSPTDFVLIDYLASSTFDAGAGYYHPAMRTVNGEIIPSSDRLLHDFLKQSQWVADERDELALLKQARSTPARVQARTSGAAEEGSVGSDARSSPNGGEIIAFGNHTHLIALEKSSDVFSGRESLNIRLQWRFGGERELCPWMLLKLTQKETGQAVIITKGLCAPEILAGMHIETWHLTSRHDLPPGEYAAEALFVDQSKRSWYEVTGGSAPDSALLSSPVSLGNLQVER